MDKPDAEHGGIKPDWSSGVPPHQYKCPKCRDTGIIWKDEKGNDVIRRCGCSVIRMIRERCGISAEFQRKTFENFKTDSSPQLSNAKTRAMQYVENFKQTEHKRHNSIMFCGQVGAGKTHLGTAICNELIDRGVEVSYMAYRNAVTKIKQHIIDEKAYSREMDKYTSSRVLYIDDLLKGRLTETDINIMYEIVNHRYMNSMPVIISTEKSPGELLEFDEAIGSRLIEMCRGSIIHFQGRELNYRLS